MPVIDPQGLFEGERLSACSDQAKFYWPYIYCASNGYARLEINLRQLRLRCFARYVTPPTDAEILGALKEYADNYLLTVYEHEGRQWAQFDTHPKYLPKHKSKKDQSSPPPPEEALAAFAEGYIEWKKAKSLCLHHSRKISETFATLRKISNGIGTGIGFGIEEGIGVGDGNTATDTSFRDKETDMKAKKEIPVLCEHILGVRAEAYAEVWNRINIYERANSSGQVIREFTEWANLNVNEEFYGKPVSAFLRSLDNSRPTEQKKAASDPTVLNLVCELAYLSGGDVTFDDKAKAGLAAEIERGNTPEEIIQVFKSDFYPTVQNAEAKNLRFAAMDFVQKVHQYVYAARRKRLEREQEAQAVARTAERMVAEAEAARIAVRVLQAQEQEAVEETLGE